MEKRNLPRFKLAICDDEPAEQEKLLALLKRCSHSKMLDLHRFSSADDFLSASLKQPFDIVLMDIEMGPPSGFEAAQELKERNHAPLVIFVTRNPGFSTRGYGIAFRYLVKPVQPNSLQEALDSAINECQASRVTFTLDNSTVILSTQNIFYIEFLDHMGTIYTDEQDIKIRATKEQLLDMLPLSWFFSPHRAYIVNLQKIATVNQKKIYLTNGFQVPISRRRYPAFNNALNRFIGR